MENAFNLKEAKQLMDDFAARTGITGGDTSQRYLWTDAFAVQSFFGLSHALDSEEYKQKALQLIDLVHELRAQIGEIRSR